MWMSGWTWPAEGAAGAKGSGCGWRERQELQIPRYLLHAPLLHEPGPSGPHFGTASKRGARVSLT